MIFLRFLLGFGLLLATIILIIRSYTAQSVSLPPAAYCGYPENPSGSLAADATHLEVWAVAFGQNCGRAFGPVVAAQRIADQKIVVTAKLFIELSSAYRQHFAAAAQAGTAPDMTVAAIGDLRTWAEQGYIIPLDTCRARYPEFNDVIDQLWSTQQWKNQIWGIPFNISLGLLYYNKVKLKALGWSEQQINDLPAQIRAGQFTLDHLMATAKQAIEAGVVQPGFGYWPRLYKRQGLQLFYTAYGGRLYDANQQKRVITQDALAKTYALQQRLIAEKIMAATFAGSNLDTWENGVVWRDAVMQGRVLFWTTGNSDWVEWTNNYVNDLGGEAYQFRTVGYALFPAATPGVPGSVLWDSTTYYAIVAEQASGRTQQAAACAVLAQTITPEINARLGTSTGEHTVLQSETDQPHFTTKRFLAETAYMWNYAVADHGRNANLLSVGPYMPILEEFMQKVEQEALSPPIAAANAVQRLQEQLGDALVVE